ncbi:DM13 domain-containing protein [Actinomycetes bacterium KLBMP 9797]
MISRLLRKPVTWLGILALAAGGAFGLYWFQPWKLVTDTEVSEALTVVSTTPPGTLPPSTLPSTAAAAPPAGPTLVGQGEFISHEHDTTGTARIIRSSDGTHRLELADLATSNGPDLRVWLTDQPVKEGAAGWRVFDDGTWVELGRLKGNRGDQSYQIPAGTDLKALTSVSIWCKRFSVSFGAADLDPSP